MHLFLAHSVFLICYGIATPLYQLIILRNEDHHHGIANINKTCVLSIFSLCYFWLCEGAWEAERFTSCSECIKNTWDSVNKRCKSLVDALATRCQKYMRFTSCSECVKNTTYLIFCSCDIFDALGSLSSYSWDSANKRSNKYLQSLNYSKQIQIKRSMNYSSNSHGFFF